MYVFIHLVIDISIYPSICPFVYLYIYLYTSTCVTTYVSIHPSMHPSLYLSIYLSSYSSIHPSIHPSILLSTHPSIRPSVYSSLHSFIHSSILICMCTHILCIDMCCMYIYTHICQHAVWRYTMQIHSRLSIYPFTHKSIYLSIYLAIHLSICLYIDRPIDLSMYYVSTCISLLQGLRVGPRMTNSLDMQSCKIRGIRSHAGLFGVMTTGTPRKCP